MYALMHSGADRRREEKVRPHGTEFIQFPVYQVHSNSPPPTPNASVLVEEEEGGGGEALGERVGSEGKQEAKAVRSVAPAC